MYKQWFSRFLQVRRRAVSIAIALDRHDATYQASSMAFWLFLGLIPLAAVIGWAVTTFAGDEVRDVIMTTLMAVTPEPAQELVDEQFRRLVGSSEAIAPLSLVGFLWIASGGVHTAVAAVQMGQVGYTRSWVRNRVLALGFVVAFLLLLVGIAVLIVMATPALSHLLQAGNSPARWMSIVRLSAWPAAAVGATFITGVFFRFASINEQRVKRTRVWPGAILVGMSWIILSWLFSLYVRSMTRYPFFYGSLAAVALIMLWLWITSFVVLAGSELNLQIEGTRHTMVPNPVAWKEQFASHLPLRLRRRRKKTIPDPIVLPAPSQIAATRLLPTCVQPSDNSHRPDSMSCIPHEKQGCDKTDICGTDTCRHPIEPPGQDASAAKNFHEINHDALQHSTPLPHEAAQADARTTRVSVVSR